MKPSNRRPAPTRKGRQPSYRKYSPALIVILLVASGIFFLSLSNQQVLGASTQSAPISGGIFSFFRRVFSRSAETPSPKRNFSFSDLLSPDKQETSNAEASGGVDVQAIPLGDGNISSSPKVGYLYSCETQFNGSAAEHAGDWIQGDTWDLTKKISVQGSVSWDTAYFNMTVNGTTRNISANGLPVGSVTGYFPIKSSDPAWQIDRNPNGIQAQTVSYSLPLEPQLADTPSCVPMGAIGYALNGVAIYNAVDAAGRDAVAHEVQDSCDGHPQGQGEYHYHGPSNCIPGAQERNTLIGYALDGFGIYSMYDKDGNAYSNEDLDECHGLTSEVEWDGELVTMYHYVLTQEYPYTIGCFRGTNPQTMDNHFPGKTRMQRQGRPPTRSN